MKPMQLDFHQSPRSTPWLGLALVVVAVIALLWVMTRLDISDQARQQLDAREDEISWQRRRLDEARNKEQKEAPSNAKVLAAHQAQQQAIGPVLAVLEQTWLPTVAYTRIELASTEHLIKLDLEAKTLADALALVDRLGSTKGVKTVSLSRHNLRASDPFHPVQVNLDIVWEPRR
ncbi:hypothetical protein HA050_00210 [Iodobacter sp. HSC-16F04]|uniref:PilN domain-containing protein n=1 Tax=Iodobacter violaceini TaxID=3044271 RepID=A0ABX0KR37_9NEIS|nr:hypothetical protein [Iodobacter violacea]NHQ84544.1 hypothetical protein [Iodobacter violacea]